MRKNQGFTLLEVLIVVSILGTLTVLSAQNLQSAIQSKKKVTEQIDDVAQVRDALKVMERDVNLAFHYIDIEKEMRELIKKKRTELAKGGPTTTVPGQPVTTTTTLPGSDPTVGVYNPNDPNDPLNKKQENRKDPTTHFIGREQELYFPTLNTARMSEEVPQADFEKVAYLLKPCRKPGQDGPSKNCLIRRNARVVEGDIDKGGDDIVLLEEISEFKLRYFGKGKQDWVGDWDSIKGDGSIKGKFPDAVEISLTVEKTPPKGGKPKKISMQLVVPIRFPNNPAPKAAGQQNIPGAINPLPGGP